MNFISKRSLAIASILLSASAFANATAKLPAEKVIAAIQLAVAKYPGQVKEVEVDEEFGRMIVDVKIESDKGMDETVKVNVDKNEVINTN